MLVALYTYRRLGVSILMLMYLASTLQGPTLEVFHILAHTSDLFHHKVTQHAYHSHEENHQHTNLDLLEQQKEDQTSNEPFLNLADLDKKNQIIPSLVGPFRGKDGQHKPEFTFLSIYRPNYREVALPPPRNVFC